MADSKPRKTAAKEGAVVDDAVLVLDEPIENAET